MYVRTVSRLWWVLGAFVGAWLIRLPQAWAGGTGAPWEKTTEQFGTSAVQNYGPWGLIGAIVGGVLVYCFAPHQESLIGKIFTYAVGGAVIGGAVIFVQWSGAPAGQTLH
jgi:hypothetical protein